MFDQHYVAKGKNGRTQGTHPIGTGPYMLERRSLDGDFELKTHRRYWRTPAKIEKLLMRNIPDPETLVRGLLYGGIDLIVKTPPEKIHIIRSQEKIKLERYRSFSIYGFAYNFNNTILNDVKVRQAFTMAVNRKQMLSQWYAGEGDVLFGPFVPGAPYYHPDLKPFPWDPEKSKQLLRQAGYRDTDGDGILERVSDGTKLSFRVAVPVALTPGTLEQNITHSYATYLREIGVEIKPVYLIKDLYTKALFIDHDFDIAYISWTFDSSYDISDLFHSSQTFPGGHNFISYSKPEIDTLIRIFKTQRDKQLRLTIMHHLQERLAVDCPYTFMYTTKNYAAIHYSYTNVKIDPYYFFTHLREWDIIHLLSGGK